MVDEVDVERCLLFLLLNIGSLKIGNKKKVGLRDGNRLERIIKKIIKRTFTHHSIWHLNTPESIIFIYFVCMDHINSQRLPSVVNAKQIVYF